MYRALLLFAITAVGCGTTDDDRPPTLEYVTEAVLAPSCGNAQCHSSFRRADGYVFDTVDATRATMTRNPGLVSTSDPDASLMMIVLTRQVDRMPYDQPLPEPDIAFIRRWMFEGAEGL
jgi:hypothetical protein